MLLDPPELHPGITWPATLTHLAKLIFCDLQFHPLLVFSPGRDQKKKKPGGSVSCAGWSPLCKAKHETHGCSGWLSCVCSNRGTRCSSIPAASIHSNPFNNPQRRLYQNGLRNLISAGHSSEEEKTARWAQEERMKNEKDFSLCYSVSFFASVTDYEPAQLMPAVLLIVPHFNNIPSGCDQSTAEPVKV